ncbi:hypothetical protein NDU88_001432 [Pleurodeles waltl]|uniref:Uncharacterized protein n=1 Tax=Pleurodeles waltl TaxID=8319 RepID=A0AAV7KS10_PLEWA|nr:hypothetical protein NDU88_001432 [Pleurodeles waltl]
MRRRRCPWCAITTGRPAPKHLHTQRRLAQEQSAPEPRHRALPGNSTQKADFIIYRTELTDDVFVGS